MKHFERFEHWKCYRSLNQDTQTVNDIWPEDWFIVGKLWGSLDAISGTVVNEFGEEVSGQSGTAEIAQWPDVEAIDRLVDSKGTVWIIDGIAKVQKKNVKKLECEVKSYDTIEV